MATRSKAWVCGLSLAGVAGSNYAGAWMSFSFERYVLSCRGLCVGLITRLIPAECGVSECDREASIVRRLWLTRGCCPTGGEKIRGTEYTLCLQNIFWKTGDICVSILSVKNMEAWALCL